MKYLEKKKVMKFGAFVALLQIFLLVSGIYAEGHLLSELNYHESNSVSQNKGIELNKLLSGFFDLMIGLLAVKQIGFVSAQVDVNCCLKTNSGAICQDVNSGISSDNYESCANPLPTKCSLTSECVTGTCVFNSGESCAANSPKKECEDKRGVWSSSIITSVNECKTGTCVLGSEIQLTTQRQCEIISQSKGLDIDFRVGLSELDFPLILGDLKKGACVIQGRNCRFGTIGECSSINGRFYENMLCTNVNLATNCLPTKKTACFQDKVRFIDSCGNIGNVYDSSKANAETNPEYWQKIVKEDCSVDINNQSSLKSCGKCDRFLSSQCAPESESEVKPNHGEFICKSLSCNDENGNERKNGEKWCLYDSQFGNGKDAVGSEHYVASCNDGKVEVNVCGTARGQICTQKVIEEGDIKISTATCQVNEAFRCFDYNKGGSPSGSCSENPHCQITNVNVDTHFKFSLCTPEYPKGFNQKDQSGLNNRICSTANNQCIVIYQKQLFGGWKCILNCECEKKKFSEQMNNLCVALGDCGSYVNYIGDGTDNIVVSGAPSVSWTEYTQYAQEAKGSYIETQLQSDFISALASQTDVDGFTPDMPADLKNLELALNLGAKGIGAGFFIVDNWDKIQSAWAQFSGEIPGVGSLDFFASFGDDLGPSLTHVGALLGPQAVSAIAGLIGNLIGSAIANALGLEGPAGAIFSTVVGSAASTGIIWAAQQGAFNSISPAIQTFANQIGLFQGLFFSIGTQLAITAIMMAITSLMGVGKTKKVIVSFKCLPWQAPSGGSKCEECNSNPFKPCTRYKCESLGQACELINENTDNPICRGLSSESTPPVISPSNIETQGYKFENQQTKSVQVRKESGECIPEFVPVTLSLKTNEYAQCKWSLKRTADYESMESYPIEGTTYSLEHKFIIGGLSLGILNANNVSGNLIEGFSGNIKAYVKCKDSFGNFNLEDYTLDFCVYSGDDVTPVLHSLTTTLPENGAKLKFGIKEVDFKMWANEPAECRYSLVQGRSHNEMENSLNCSTNLEDYEGFGWPCSTKLNVQGSTTFYIKCLDQPWLNATVNESKRNANTQDFVYHLDKSNGILEIKSISVFYNSRINLDFNKTTDIRGSGAIFPIRIDVLTAGGVSGGKSTCSYQWGGSYIPFFNTYSNSHSQELILLPGSYDIGIKCFDDAGNEDIKDAQFKINTDNKPPIAVRTYHSSGKLVLVTNEQAKCYVSFDKAKECNFNIDNSSAMEVGFSLIHLTSWESGKTYYVKCKDLWNNQNSKCAVKVTTS